MDQIGRVVDKHNGIAKVQVTRNSACGGECGKCAGCSSIGVTIEAKDVLDAQVGEYVEISSKASYLRKAVIWMYIIPLIALFVGIGVGTLIFQWLQWKSNLEILQITVGFMAMAGVYLFIRKMNTKLTAKEDIGFEITKIMRQIL